MYNKNIVHNLELTPGPLVSSTAIPLLPHFNELLHVGWLHHTPLAFDYVPDTAKVEIRMKCKCYVTGVYKMIFLKTKCYNLIKIINNIDLYCKQFFHHGSDTINQGSENSNLGSEIRRRGSFHTLFSKLNVSLANQRLTWIIINGHLCLSVSFSKI